MNIRPDCFRNSGRGGRDKDSDNKADGHELLSRLHSYPLENAKADWSVRKDAFRSVGTLTRSVWELEDWEAPGLSRDLVGRLPSRSRHLGSAGRLGKSNAIFYSSNPTLLPYVYWTAIDAHPATRRKSRHSQISDKVPTVAFYLAFSIPCVEMLLRFSMS